jgi:hypothetical protein
VDVTWTLNAPPLSHILIISGVEMHFLRSVLFIGRYDTPSLRYEELSPQEVIRAASISCNRRNGGLLGTVGISRPDGDGVGSQTRLISVTRFAQGVI